MKLKKILVTTSELILGLAILGSCLYWIWEQTQKEELSTERKKDIPVVAIETVSYRPHQIILEGIGNSIANESATITSSVSEKVTELFFTDGQLVKKGDRLVQLNDVHYQAELEQVKINLAEYQREYDRSLKLVERKAIAQKELDSCQTCVARAKTAIIIVQYQISNRHITAPFSGRIGMRQVSIGDLVTPGDIICTLDDISCIKVDFKVPEKYYSKIKLKQKITLTNSAYPNHIFSGEISAISPRIDPQTRSIEIRAIIPNPESLLTPGMLCLVQLNLGEVQTLMIPEKAIVSLGEMQYLFLYDEKTSLVKRIAVTLGERADGYVEVIKGLDVGVKIVSDGVLKLVDGTKVMIEGKK